MTMAMTSTDLAKLMKELGRYFSRREVINSAMANIEPQAYGRAHHWLDMMLSPRGLKVALEKIKGEAKKEKISMRSVYRAAIRLRVQTSKKRLYGFIYTSWVIPKDADPD